MRIQSSAATTAHSTPASSHLPTSSTPFSALVSPTNATKAATPVGSSPSTGSSADTGDVQSALDQSQDQNMQFLQLQSQMNTQSESFTTLSNVMKTENDTIRNTAGNMQI